MKDTEIKIKFDSIAKQYDEQRRELIPCYDDFYNIATESLELSTELPKILDLGAGTGLFSNYVINKYPKAELILVDISEKMLDIAKKNFNK